MPVKLYGDYQTINVKDLKVNKFGLTSTYYGVLPATIILGSTIRGGSSEFADYKSFLASTVNSTIGIHAYEFDATKTEYVTFTATLPTDYYEGTAITPYIHFFTTSSTGCVAGGTTGQQYAYMGISYLWYNLDAAFSSTQTESYLSLSPTTAILQDYTTNFTAISSTSKEVGSKIIGTIFRLSTASTDTFDNNLWVTGLTFYYQKDGLGSTLGISDK